MLLRLDGVSKSVGADTILSDVSFLIEEGEKAALVGVNGAGKTSIFRILTREWQPDDGGVSISSERRVGYLPQLDGFNPDETENTNDDYPPERTLYAELDSVFEHLRKTERMLRECEAEMGRLSGRELDQTMERYTRLSHEFEERGGYEYASRVRGVLIGLGFPRERWEQPMRQLSGGERTRAALGKLLLISPDLLLLDEPTNHLDIESVSWLEDYLRSYGGAMIIISHDRYFLDRIVSKTIEVENKKTHVYNGNYSFYAKYKAEGRDVKLRQYLQQQKEIKRHEEVVKTLRSFGTEAAIIRAKSREKLIGKIERIEKPESLPDKMRLMLTPRIQSGGDVLNVEGLSMGFNGKKLFEGVSFELKRGERAAVIGPNGIGKTTLFKILTGKISPLSGRIYEGVNVRIGYYDQNLRLVESDTFVQSGERNPENKTVFDELSDAFPRLTNTEIRNVLAAFVFTGEDVFKPVSALSGGELGRVSLAKIMLAGSNLLLLDEPTNHLDMFSREVLEEALRDFPGTALYISHDRYFINNTATKIYELNRNGFTEYAGNYDYYAEKKRESVPLRSAEYAAYGETNEWRKKKEADSDERKRVSRLKRLESQIAETEARVLECEAKLSEDEIATDAYAAGAVFREKTDLEERLLALYTEHDETY